MLDWNDLRYFLAVARETAARSPPASALRVSQTTVARRIAALEEALGFPFFEKRQAGYALTPAGRRAARSGPSRSRRAANAFAEAAAAQCPRAAAAQCKITTEEVYCDHACSHRCCASCTNTIRRS